MSEQIVKSKQSALEIYNEVIGHEPKLITNFVPSDAVAQKELFNSGDVRNPDHLYAKLDAIDFDDTINKIEIIGEIFQDGETINPKHLPAYEQFINDYIKKTELMQAARNYKSALSSEEKSAAAIDFMKLNIELYSEPDQATYSSLLAEKLDSIAEKELSPTADTIRQELFMLVGYDPELSEKTERFRPSQEAIEWVQGAAETLYGGMLSHVPDQELFTVAETKDIFTKIIREEFGEAASEWRVDVEPAKSINVKSTEMRIVIPEDRGDLSKADIRRLIVHEIGVHMLRSVTGQDTDLAPLKSGLSGYYDFEEGLGMVMEQAIQGEFKEAGVDHYITAGLAYFDNKDFRDIYEIKWRLSVLAKSELTEDAIEKSKNAAYGGTMRSLRGTDELPWFKDLAYYNGSVDVWKHLEKIKGDDILFQFVLLGKADPSGIDHQRILLDTSTKA